MIRRLQATLLRWTLPRCAACRGIKQDRKVLGCSPECEREVAYRQANGF